MSMQVKVRITARAAILARKATIGVLPVNIEDTDLADLDMQVLASLAEVMEGGEILEGPGVIDATFASVLAGLDARTARLADKAAAEEAATARARAAEARAAAEAAEERRRARDMEARHAGEITKWIEDNCDDDMIERRRQGFLNDDEIIEEVMDQMFDITADEHVSIKKHEACDCDKGCTGAVRSFVLPVEHLDTHQYAALHRIREEAPKNAVVTPQMRKAACPECSCVPLARMTALVELEWCGWMLRKAYALG